MLSFDAKEKKFMEQFKGTDLETIFEREKNKFFNGSVYNIDRETRELFRGASQCMDAILVAIQSKDR